METKQKTKVVVKLGKPKKQESNTFKGRITIATPEKEIETKVAWELFKRKIGISKETQAFYKLWEIASIAQPELFPSQEELVLELEKYGLVNC